VELTVLLEYLRDDKRVFITDDFLTSGQTIARIAQAASAQVMGVGALIEKTFESKRHLTCTSRSHLHMEIRDRSLLSTPTC